MNGDGMKSRGSGMRSSFVVVSTFCLVSLASGAVSLRAQMGSLFPEPFKVVHHVAQDDDDGTRFVGEDVRDTYGGSWLVSERPDGSRLILDFSRREISEVRTAQGTYWTVSFDSLAALAARMRRAQGLDGAEAKKDEEAPREATLAKTAEAESAEVVVTEVAGGAVQRMTAAGGTLATAADTSPLLARPGVRHLRVALRASTEPAGFDAWVDPSLRLTAGAVAALGQFEEQVSDAGQHALDRQATADLSPSRALAAVRRYGDGAFVVRTVRPLATASGATSGTIEDSVTRLDRLERFPPELAQIPDGLRRVAHPLEAAVRFLEEDRARDAAMSGRHSAPAGSRER